MFQVLLLIFFGVVNSQNCHREATKLCENMSGLGTYPLPQVNSGIVIPPLPPSRPSGGRKRREISYQNAYEAPHTVIDVGKVIVWPPPGVAPNDSPQPGQPGGGAPPETDPETAAFAPDGTVPIAVFPPFSEYQKNPKKCVIFSELTDFEKLALKPSGPYRVRKVTIKIKGRLSIASSLFNKKIILLIANIHTYKHCP